MLPVSADGDDDDQRPAHRRRRRRATARCRSTATPGFDRLVDDGDQGDTYNYSPPDHDIVVDTPTAVTVTCSSRVRCGPHRGRAHASSGPTTSTTRSAARVGLRSVDIATTCYDLHAGERMVRVHTTFDNPSRDHRLRAHMPLPERAARSRADCAFAVPERGLAPRADRTSASCRRIPAKRFVQAGGLTVIVRRQSPSTR